MKWFHIVAWLSLVACLGVFLGYFIRLVRLGKPKDQALAQGNTSAGIRYAYLGSMMPQHKESAYLHLPTYVAGIVYHLGTFLSLLLLAFFLVNTGIRRVMPALLGWLFFACLSVSVFCGILILLKRFVKAELRSFSNPDDYLSNGLTTLFQLATALYSVAQTAPSMEMFYFLAASLFLIWLPLGKTRHALYFFFARYHLGFFYGRRGTWPEHPVL